MSLNDSHLEALRDVNGGESAEGHMHGATLTCTGASMPSNIAALPPPYLLNSMQSSSMPAYSASDDHKIVVILVRGGMSNSGAAETAGASPHDYAPVTMKRS